MMQRVSINIFYYNDQPDMTSNPRPTNNHKQFSRLAIYGQGRVYALQKAKKTRNLIFSKATFV